MITSEYTELVKDKVVVVTGAAGVIGETLVRAFLAAGAKLAIADLAAPTDLALELDPTGTKVFPVEVDVSDKLSTDRMAAAVGEHFGHIDVVINNAGFFRGAKRGPFDEIPLQEWDLAYRVNVLGVWNVSSSVLRHMLPTGSGKIINIGSNTVFRGVPNFLHYVSSKAGLIGLTRSMALRYGSHNVAVNILYPDFIPDAGLLAAQPGNNERLVAGRCFKRTQVPEDMVGAAMFLASEQSSFVTGQSINVNGGAYFL